MFNDMQTSRDLNTAFRDKFISTGNFDIGGYLPFFSPRFPVTKTSPISSSYLIFLVDMSVLVLCTGAWPLSPPTSTFNIPQALEKGITLFQQFYQNQHNGRKLHWLYQLSKGEVKANYFKHTKTGYTLQVSTYQMSILLQYNTVDVLSFEELTNNTHIVADILKQILENLTKAKILIADGDLESPGTKYRLNFDFKSKKYRINLNVPLKTEQKQEQEETHQHVQEDRKILIQAAVVRIMKDRKTLAYNHLVTETISQLQSRFKPTIPDIKKSIDILIEKEYLMRAEGQKDTFHYLA